MMGGHWFSYVIIAVGAFSIAGAVLDWDWFMESRKARLWVGLFGRVGARIFYILLGVGIIVLGGMLMTGAIELSRR